ncbi:MAG: putative transposase, partial [Saprospiraceae bacterium]
MPDHIHIAARLRSDIAPSVFVQKVKANSSKWINASGFSSQEFAWQTGGATFSISETHVEALQKYIISQKEHHKQVSFRSEYLKLLKS